MSAAFDLHRFAPPPFVAFKLRKHGDHEFQVDADPDVDDVATMLRIENVIRGIDEGGEIKDALPEGKALLLRMIQEQQPDVEVLRIGAQELTVVFSLIVHGSSVAEAVANAITAANARDAEGDVGDGDEQAAALEPVEGEDVESAPLASAKRSSGRSSGSGERDAGLLATGTA